MKAKAETSFFASRCSECDVKINNQLAKEFEKLEEKEKLPLEIEFNCWNCEAFLRYAIFSWHYEITDYEPVI